jgi:hypothetical protein
METILKKIVSRANRIGMVEDVVVGEVAGQIIQISSATITASMGTTQKSANQMLSAIIVVSMDIMQMCVISKKR